jgi:hypothetical protein
MIMVLLNKYCLLTVAINDNSVVLFRWFKIWSFSTIM